MINAQTGWRHIPVHPDNPFEDDTLRVYTTHVIPIEWPGDSLPLLIVESVTIDVWTCVRRLILTSVMLEVNEMNPHDRIQSKRIHLQILEW